jgi:serine/threonine-protein kinase HipA
VISELSVSLSGDAVAEVRTRSNRVQLRYSPAVEQRFAGRPMISCSLPVTTKWADATSFFDGVLPEGQFRAALAALAGVSAADTFALLARYGRDVAGALVVAESNCAPDGQRGSLINLTEDDLIDEVLALPDRPLGVHDDSELSIAGLQNKLLLVRRHDGGWARPIGGTPSTHIVKLDSQAHPGVVAAEASAMRLARHVGLTTVATELAVIGGIVCLIVERFDRVVTDGRVERLHQEDACQALGIAPTQKYELPGRGFDRRGGGPEFAQIAGLLDRYAVAQIAELRRLVATAVFTAIIGNADAHGKNLALIHDEPGHIRLAPLYDTVPTVLFPRLTADAAMTIGATPDLARVDAQAIIREAARWPLARSVALAAAAEVAEQLRDAIRSSVIDPQSTLGELVLERADRFLQSVVKIS